MFKDWTFCDRKDIDGNRKTVLILPRLTTGLMSLSIFGRGAGTISLGITIGGI
jgi:hypothetical protein